eukprot:m.351444 g.351444  ORF g.351444 m.351444 type:complete len:331 (-) comp19897_c0_seq3:48-1040(-)
MAEHSNCLAAVPQLCYARIHVTSSDKPPTRAEHANACVQQTRHPPEQNTRTCPQLHHFDQDPTKNHQPLWWFGLQGGRRKCERYWPDEEGDALMYGTFEITTQETIDCGDHVQTTMLLRNHAEPRSATRQVKHFWFTGWPDHGAPDETWPILELLRSVREATAQSMSPMVVHCSAGIGRSGTFMALHIGMQELQNQWRVVDVLRTVSKMRQERGGVVQTPVQYHFIYRVLADYVTPNTRLSMFGDNKPRQVKVTKAPGQSFGFKIRGSFPVFFVSVDPLSVAAKAGCHVGDHVLRVNGSDVSQMTHGEVVRVIRDCGNTVTFDLLAKLPF